MILYSIETNIVKIGQDSLVKVQKTIYFNSFIMMVEVSYNIHSTLCHPSLLIAYVGGLGPSFCGNALFTQVT